MKIIIIGGGIGGFTAALALQPQHEVHVYERSPSFEPLGTGIGIGSNALQALIDLGIGEDVRKFGNPINRLLFLDEKGETLNFINFGHLNKNFGVENLTIHRGHLHQILYSYLFKQNVHFNKHCLNVTYRNDKVYATFQDGEEVHADLLIAADGISSVIRQAILPESTPKYAGYTCWRGVTGNNGLVNTDTSSEIWSTKGRFGYAPLIDNKLYWFACINAEQQDAYYQNVGPERLAEMFKDHPPIVRNMILNTDSDTLLHHDISDIKPLSQFVFNRIVLLGDAAHATTPNMGQGAGQAIEDAVTLANLLKRYEVNQALNMYEKERTGHTKKVIQISRMIGKASQIQSPFLAWIRNFIFHFVPSRLLIWRLKFLFERNLS
ncbi:FAD-dependent monooxygenase [Bacillus sp. V5-8f]|uniref:FAD-dependent monooxygenase n=1 Tax=Bacillus sp. V5-8f TaxID=2053044 RepID=UPI0015E0F63A|nr:FAD-dependent monooxygenase [Bacillus sp. V5-8f]